MRRFLDHKASRIGSWTLYILKVVGKKLHGMTKVEGIISGHLFRAALEPNTRLYRACDSVLLAL